MQQRHSSDVDVEVMEKEEEGKQQRLLRRTAEASESDAPPQPDEETTARHVANTRAEPEYTVGDPWSSRSNSRTNAETNIPSPRKLMSEILSNTRNLSRLNQNKT
jgi:hypothetical protein